MAWARALNQCFQGLTADIPGDRNDQRAHPLVADPDARRDLSDPNAPVEIIDDQPIPLECLQPRDARVR